MGWECHGEDEVVELEWERKFRTHEPLSDPHLSVPTERERRNQRSRRKKVGTSKTGRKRTGWWKRRRRMDALSRGSTAILPPVHA
jgi:hypothetical protein